MRGRNENPVPASTIIFLRPQRTFGAKIQKRGRVTVRSPPTDFFFLFSYEPGPFLLAGTDEFDTNLSVRRPIEPNGARTPVPAFGFVPDLKSAATPVVPVRCRARAARL